MNNLFISYELNDSKENLENIDKAIQALGNSTKLHNSCWYVNSPENAENAIKHISRFLTDQDVLIVSDTSNDETTWFNLEEKLEQRVRQNWKM
jgi:hypothetical protein